MVSGVVDVLPQGSDGWLIAVGEKQGWRVYQDKGEAIARAKEIARADSGYLIIRGSDGEIQTRRSFRKLSGVPYVS